MKQLAVEIPQYFDPRKFNPDDFARVGLECRVGSNAERVAPFVIEIDKFGNPNFEVGINCKTDELELRGMRSGEILARMGYRRVIWFSPPGGEKKYPESRITVWEVDDIDGEKVRFKGKGICCQINGSQMIEMVQSLFLDGSQSIYEINNGDDLRGTMIGLNEFQNWNYFMKKFPELEEVWESIIIGKDERMLQEMMIVARWVERNFGSLMGGISGREESIYVGALIERSVRARFGLRLMSGGGHGMSNESLIGNENNLGPFDSMFRMNFSEGLHHSLIECKNCHKCYLKKRGLTCPVCHYVNDN